MATEPDPPAVRADPAALRAEIESDVTRLARLLGPGLRTRWEAVRGLTEPADLARLAEQAASLEVAAGTVRRQHTETAEDLGPLWDTWAGPAADAVQDRVSALARSAHALVVELETTAGRLTDARNGIVDALEALAERLAAGLTTTDGGGPVAACERAAAACTAAWDDARHVLAGGVVGGAGDVSRFGPRCP